MHKRKWQQVENLLMIKTFWHFTLFSLWVRGDWGVRGGGVGKRSWFSVTRGMCKVGGSIFCLFVCLEIILKRIKNVTKKKAVQGDIYVPIACNDLNAYLYIKLQKDKSRWYCIYCLQKELPQCSTGNTFETGSCMEIKWFLQMKICP